MYAATVHGLWAIELNVWIQSYKAIKSDKKPQIVLSISTHAKDDKVQFAVMLTRATTEAEKKSKDASGAATRRTWRDILVRQRCGWWEGSGRIGHAARRSKLSF
jgi:hypothetical protein